MKDVVKQNESGSLMTFTNDQIELIKKQVAPDATKDELALFLYVAKKTGLDPLSRQVYCIHRTQRGGGKRMTIQTGIDGFRVIAQRSGEYAGQDEPEFVYEKNIKTGENELLCAKVSVYKWHDGIRFLAAVGVAFWDEYCLYTDEWENGRKTGNQVPQAMWAKMPHGQLAKVAEALALRKAFPQDLSGIYTKDELDQADNDVDTTELRIVENEEQLKETFSKLWVQYSELVGSKVADPYHVDNWKVAPTKQNLVLAIDHMKQLIQEVKDNQPK